jgi:hypothetical protein
VNQAALFDSHCPHRNVRQVDSATLRCADCKAWLSSGYVAEQRKVEGIERVLANEDSEWVTRAKASAYRVAHRKREFTVEDLRDEWLREGLGSPHSPNCIGALFHTIKREGIAIPTDRTCKATHLEGHGRSIRIWRSCLA